MIDVVPDKKNKVWKIKEGGTEVGFGGFKTQIEAIAVAREVAKSKKEELAIHGLNGQIREKNSYGNDPRNIKG